MKKENDLLKELKFKNRLLLKTSLIICFIGIVFLFGIMGLTIYFLNDSKKIAIIVLFALIIFLIICFYALYLEVQAGNYQCKHCKHLFVPKYINALFAVHVWTTRYLKCPKCHKHSWAKKVI